MRERKSARANIKFVRVSPQKIRMLRDDVVKLSPGVTLDALFMVNTRAGKALYKAVKSAVDNAKQTLKADPAELKFTVLKIDEGPAFKRFRAGSKGMAKSYKRRSSHIYIEVEKKSATNYTNHAVREPEAIQDKKKEQQVSKVIKNTQKK